MSRTKDSMAKTQECAPLTEEDLRAALKEMNAYVDVTEEDLKKIFEIALRHARERISARIPVAEVMTRNVVTVKRGADLHEAARLLSENRISGMPVVDDDNNVIAVVSDADLLMLAGMKRGHVFKDILHRILGEPVAPQTTGVEKVEDVMTSPPITCKVDDDVAQVAKMLDERRIKRLPVVDDEGKIVGIISRTDTLRAIVKIS